MANDPLPYGLHQGVTDVRRVSGGDLGPKLSKWVNFSRDSALRNLRFTSIIGIVPTSSAVIVASECA
jgi:hypothetical protein